MDRPPLLVDMNVSPRVVAALRQAGWDAIRVSERLPATSPDEVVLAFARREGRVMVTEDLDYSALLALGGFERPSLVTLRLTSGDPEVMARRLVVVLPGLVTVLASGAAVTVEDDHERIRVLPIAR
jgi:predicted nuclease of predicted toxin-antitoxin system